MGATAPLVRVPRQTLPRQSAALVAVVGIRQPKHVLREHLEPPDRDIAEGTVTLFLQMPKAAEAEGQEPARQTSHQRQPRQEA